MKLHAGAATRDITPACPVQLVGYPHQPRLSTGTHDPLLASALYVSHGQAAVLLASLDLLMVNADVARRWRQQVAAALQLPESHVLISCTHTHSGPPTLHYLPWQGDPAMPAPDPGYLAFVEQALVAAALEARDRALPAQLAWTTALAHGVGGNRHDPEGLTDPEVGILALRSEQRLLALSVTYGMHPTVLHEDSTLFSGDFPASTRRFLREACGHDLVVLWHTGPAGDQSPRHFVQGQTFAEADRLGQLLAVRIQTALSNLRWTDAAPLGGVLHPVDLPRRRLPDVAVAAQELAGARARFEQGQRDSWPRPQLRTAEVAVFGAEGACRLAQQQADGSLDRFLQALQPFEVQALRLGEACLVGIPGELFAEFGLQLKARSPVPTFPISYVNGELQGYIVTPAAAAAGGYEAASRLFAIEAGSLLVDAGLAAIRAVRQLPPPLP